MSSSQATARVSGQTTTNHDALPSEGMMAAIGDVSDNHSPGEMYASLQTNEEAKKRLGASGDWHLQQSSCGADDAKVFRASCHKFGEVELTFTQWLNGVPYMVTQKSTLPPNVEHASIASTADECGYTWWNDLGNNRFQFFDYKDATGRLICRSIGTSCKLDVTYSNYASPESKEPSCVTDLRKSITQRLSSGTGGIRASTGSRV